MAARAASRSARVGEPSGGTEESLLLIRASALPEPCMLFEGASPSERVLCIGLPVAVCCVAVDGGVRPSYRPLRPVGGPSAVSQRACSATISSHPRRPARILAGICDRGTAASPHACAVAARGLVGEVHFVTIDAPQIKALGVVAEGGGGGGRFAGHDRLRAAHQPTHWTARSRHVPGGSEPCWVGP